MRTYSFPSVAALAVAGLAFIRPVDGFAQEESTRLDGPALNQEPATGLSMDEGLPPMDRSAPNANEFDPPRLAKSDYCYAGSVIDPVTGESVDLYTLCTDDLDRA